MMLKNDIVKIFLIITFALMYVSALLMILLLKQFQLDFSHPVFIILQFISGGSPTIATFFILYNYYSEKKRKNYFKRLFLLNVSLKWWFFSILSPLVIIVILNLVNDGNLSNINIDLKQLLRFPLIFIISIFLGGLEELGWRGILLDELKSGYSLIKISIFTGVLWGFWHLPLFFIEPLHRNFPFIPYLVSTVMFSALMTFIVISTKSIGLAVIMHAAINSFSSYGISIPFNNSLIFYISLSLITFFSFYCVYSLNKLKVVF